MKKFVKKIFAILIVFALLSGSFTCLAAELNSDAVSLHKGQYKNYLLLGDSVASGYRDQMSDNDAAFNAANQQTTYYRVPGSYADILANAIIEDKSMTAFAAPGFRTREIRYMLEDDFDGTDDYMFHPSQLNTVGFAGSEEFRAAYKKAIADADLITLGVGGNDWGAYLGWVISDILEKENKGDEYAEEIKAFLENKEVGIGDIEKLVEIAHLAGALPELLSTLPKALEHGLGGFYDNWDIMIQDIYDLNPDVTLMVVGMSDNGLKGKYFDYDGVTGAPVSGGELIGETDEATASIIEFIMSVGNKPMIEGAKKFGYTYVDISGTTYVDSHPDADGHINIANKIIEALPHPDFVSKFEDVNPGHKNYKEIEFVLRNNIMTATTDTTFSPDDALTNGQLNQALNVLTGTDNATNDTSDTTALKIVISFLKAGLQKGLSEFFGTFKLSFKILADNGYKFTSSVTRGAAANYFKAFSEI